MGITPWPFTWAEYRRMFLGWRRQRWEFFGTLCSVSANGLLPRKDDRSWQTSDFTPLVKPAPRWRKRVKSGLERLKTLFRHEVPMGGDPGEGGVS